MHASGKNPCHIYEYRNSYYYTVYRIRTTKKQSSVVTVHFMSAPSVVSFDDVMEADGEEDAAERMFELANASTVSFRALPGVHISIRQDPANSTTGGCIWETSYLLARWALRELEPRLSATVAGDGSKLRVLELGSGCGLLGISLGCAGAHVLLTETAEAMDNLIHNVEANHPPTHRGGSTASALLHWGNEDHIDKARMHGPFDLCLGTDVVYVTSMVRPLLWTLWRCCTQATEVWLCGQVRDPDAHATLIRESPLWFETVEREPLTGFAFAEELECFLLRLSCPARVPPAMGDGDPAAQPTQKTEHPMPTATASNPLETVGRAVVGKRKHKTGEASEMTERSAERRVTTCNTSGEDGMAVSGKAKRQQKWRRCN